jgi:hypothetical protein
MLYYAGLSAINKKPIDSLSLISITAEYEAINILLNSNFTLLMAI